mmetsp:Transcript_24382/g.59161  ORF Transcript_24382/g.59161 Transcript_24382/m.59161 type:complete len:277 (-) Transcript_24382:315-1145(-)
MIPGIDLAGTVVQSENPEVKVGDKVVLNGFGVGEGSWGGLATRWRGPASFLIPLAQGMTPATAMAIGTAGYTAMLCVLALERHGVTPESGPVLVTGACGGVGTVAVAVLSKLGYKVVALTGRADAEGPFLKSLGASEIMPREELTAKGPPLATAQFAGVVDSVGSTVLANALARTKYQGVVTACGLAGGADLPATVMPFILRGVTLAGIDSVQAPREARLAAWNRLATDLTAEKLALISSSQTISLAEVPAAAEQILQGQIRGRVVVDLTKPAVKL